MDNHHLSNITKLKKKPVLSFRSIMPAFEGITFFERLTVHVFKKNPRDTRRISGGYLPSIIQQKLKR